MSPPAKHSSNLVLSVDELEEILSRAAERGARRALTDVGLDGDNAKADIRELRSLLQALRFAKTTALQTAIRIITTSLLLALMVGISIKLKLFGSTQ